MERLIIKRASKISRKMKEHWSFLENYLKLHLKRLSDDSCFIDTNNRDIIEEQIKKYNERHNTSFYIE